MTIIVRLPYLSMRNFRKLESGKHEAHLCSHRQGLGPQRLVIDQVRVIYVCWQGSFDCPLASRPFHSQT
jgi:hypothetical protein